LPFSAVGNVQSIRRLQHVQILTTTTFSYWFSRSKFDQPLKEPSLLKTKLSCNELHAIASPIHCLDHWTSVILLNKNFIPGQSSFNPDDWRLLYFDSLSPKKGDLTNASEFSKWLLQLKPGSQLEATVVPTPRQLPGSNDCGLLAAHFLHVFLRSFERNAKLYSSVSLLFVI
jgi:hypothetical protein